MKKIYILVVAFCCLITSSCNDTYLDKAPGVDLTEDNAFLNKANLEIFMSAIYKYSVHSIFRYGTQNSTDRKSVV